MRSSAVAPLNAFPVLRRDRRSDARVNMVLGAVLGLRVRGSVVAHEAGLGGAVYGAEEEEDDGVHVHGFSGVTLLILSEACGSMGT